MVTSTPFVSYLSQTLTCYLIFAQGCDLDAKRIDLMRSLKDTYSAMNQPSLNSATPTTVTYDIALRQLLAVDEKHEVVSLLLWERSSWRDHHLKWDPELYCNISEIRMKESEIWIPDIVISNSVSDFLRASDSLIPLQVTHTGAVKWNSPATRHISCQIKVKYFPYDRQECELDLVSWTYTSDKIRLKLRSERGLDLSTNMESNEWTVLNTSSHVFIRKYEMNAASHYHIRYKLLIERKPLYYLFYLFLPSSIIMVLSLMIFLLPTDSGEKATLSIMVLLSLFILMVTVSEKLPANSKALPLLSTYFVANMITIAISMVLSVAIINIHFHPAHLGSKQPKLTSRVKNLAFNKLAPYLGMDVSSVEDEHDQLEKVFEQKLKKNESLLIDEVAQSSSEADAFDVILEKLAIVENCSLYVVGYFNTHFRKEQKHRQWVACAKIIDRLLLLIFSVVFVVTSAMILAFKFYNDSDYY